jgi:uncharacterized protein (DUF1501 family)
LYKNKKIKTNLKIINYRGITMGHTSKRHFLKLLATLGAAGLTSSSIPLLGIGSLAAQNTSVSNDYKALVCIFLIGGNDSHNMIIPYDTSSYANYKNQRTTLAIPYQDLLPIYADNVQDGKLYALHPNLLELQQMFNNGNMAVLANVGPLIVPTTKTNVINKNVPLPPKLFSHNDQQSIWQSSLPEGARIGFGGRMADILQTYNQNSVFTSISTTGNALFLSGQYTTAYTVNNSGILPNRVLQTRNMFDINAPAIIKQMLTQSYTQLMEKDMSRINQTAFDANAVAELALASATSVTNLPPYLQDSRLAKQLKMVAQLMSARSGLGVKREIFFVALNGFDTHDNQLQDQARLFFDLSKSMQYFYDNLQLLGLENQVVTFTSSEFGRTLISNGDGSDHGWGGHHLIMGGNVKGKNIYGTWPELDAAGPNSIETGRLIPTTSVEQYLAEFATWLGVPSSNLLDVLPNLVNFNQQSLGILKVLGV